MLAFLTLYHLFTVTLIGSNEKPHGTSNFSGEFHHHNTAATNYNKTAFLCIHRREFLATLFIIMLLVITVTAVIIHFSSKSGDDLRKHTFYPAPKGNVRCRVLSSSHIHRNDYRLESSTLLNLHAWPSVFETFRV
jgi:hypothetical protein